MPDGIIGPRRMSRNRRAAWACVLLGGLTLGTSARAEPEGAKARAMDLTTKARVLRDAGKKCEALEKFLDAYDVYAPLYAALKPPPRSDANRYKHARAAAAEAAL